MKKRLRKLFPWESGSGEAHMRKAGLALRHPLDVFPAPFHLALALKAIPAQAQHQSRNLPKQP